MILTLLLIFIVLAALFLGYASTRPGTIEVARSTSVNAPAERIFPLINNFHEWAAWSPYEKRDPAMKKTYGGAPIGPGATYEWKGNREVGEGRMEIIEANQPGRLAIKLDFLEPFEGHNVTEFTMVPAGGATRVTWRMTGPSAFMTKVIGVFVNMDRMIGGDFEKGLAALKEIAEQ